MKIKIPNIRNKHLLTFCRRLVLGSSPVYISHQPLNNKPIKECFSIVSEHIASYEGKPKYGWAIFEFKGVWLEAEFHVVLEKENGDIVDITPRQSEFDKILFLPTPEMIYEGKQINSIFYPLSKKPSVKEFIKLSKAHFKASNKGKLANIQRGVIDSQEVEELNYKIQNVMQQIAQEHGA